MVTKRQYNVSVCRMCLILVTKPNNVYIVMNTVYVHTKRQYNVSVCRMCLILVTKPNNVYCYEHCLCAHSRLLLVALDSHLKLTL